MPATDLGPLPASLRARCGQLVMARLGSNLPPGRSAPDDADRVAALLDEVPLGGLLVFNGAWPALPATLTRLQRAASFPLLIASDVERGVGQQVQGGTHFPHARAVARAGADGAATLARITAHEARACGIHLAFAPVADVNLTDANPIIDTRAFGTTPARVTPCVQAYVRTAQQHGLLTVAKHFPGHGRTTTDSHATLPVVDATTADWMRDEAPPFRAACDAGVAGLMTAHVAYPALEPAYAPQRPATASPALLRDLLRDGWGFSGVVFSDSLLMEGIRATADVGTHAARLIRAGVDVLLDPDDPAAVVEGLVQAVRDGALPVSLVDAACRRVWRLKAQVAARTAWRPAPDHAFGTAAHQEAADELAARALQAPASLPQSTDWCVLYAGAGRAASPDPLVRGLRRGGGTVSCYTLPETPTAEDKAAFDRATQTASHLLVACAVGPAAWHRFGLSKAQTAALRRWTRTARMPHVVYAALGAPHALQWAPERAPRCITYSDVPAAQQALAHRLLPH
ncbi:glycoside hydrolase family 3 N-terminal domain-containing protein [Salisaeta longa]|uniref:glycoside hydrolase family 3 N-terminal domain-containing protein n=1 Tax=Salisaeta longa TaxID=503170 RepID=UPI0003B5A4E9|nr:glycoside hydrolase family 3 N-terminal domain-containing protein [Salisaeta longa]